MSPDGSAKPLPEERLLKLIRSKAARPAAATAAGSSAVAAAGMRGVPAGRWLQLGVTGLGAVLAFEVLLLVMEAIRPAPNITMPMINAAPDSTSPVVVPPTPALSQGMGRPLFGAGPDTAPEPAGNASGPSASLTQLAARLTLLGLVPGEPGQAIIEDSQTQKTYFVSPGQPVAEGAVVERILENRVILDLRGEKLELSL